MNKFHILPIILVVLLSAFVLAQEGHNTTFTTGNDMPNLDNLTNDTTTDAGTTNMPDNETGDNGTTTADDEPPPNETVDVPEEEPADGIPEEEPPEEPPVTKALSTHLVQEKIQITPGQERRATISLTDVEENKLLDLSFNPISEKTLLINEHESFEIAITAQEPFTRIDRVFLVPSEGREFEAECQADLTCEHTFDIVHETPGTYEYNLIINLEYPEGYFDQGVWVDDETISIGPIRPDITDFVITKSFTIRVIDEQQYRQDNRGPLNYIEEDLDKQDSVRRMFQQDEISLIEARIERAKTAEKALEIYKPAPEYVEGKSIYTIKIKPKENWKAEEVMVYEEIPKSVAQDINELTFEGMDLETYQTYIKEKYADVNGYVQALREDPLMVWHFASVEEEIELKYEIEKKVRDDEIGNTFVTAQKATRTDSWRTYLFPIIVVCIVVPIILYFAKFKKKPEKTEVDIKMEEKEEKGKEKIEVDAERKEYSGNNIKKDQIVKLEYYVKNRLKKGHKKEDIKKDVMKVQWPEDIVEEIFEKM